MHIINKLTPDFYFESISEIPRGFFAENGIKALICDIDNTLVTYDDPRPTNTALDFIALAKSEGVEIAFASNNNHERVALFNSSLGFFAEGRASKPRRGVLRRAMAHLNAAASHTAILGDQIFTDVYCGHRAGIRSILVNPIKDKKTPFFRFKRMLERPFLRRYKRRLKKTNKDK